MKKIISVLLSFAMVLSILAINSNPVVNAAQQEAEWKSNAIITPKEGALVGAGYIDIKFDSTLENAESYTVYFDGKSENQLVDGTMATMTFDAESGVTTQTCEVYSVAVKEKHTAYVTAKLKNGTTVTSDIRTFYLSKKGVAMGGDMSDTVEIGKLNISWYYNWATAAFNSSVDAGVAHVPMVWGAAQSNLREIKNITDDSNYILGYNEPDIESQANLSAGKGLAAWKYVAATGKRTVSPALAVYNGSFLDKFLKTGDTYDPTQEPEDNEDEDSTTEGEVIPLEGGFYAAVDVDAVALHRYGGCKTDTDPDVSRLTDAIDWLWERYHKPIWVTEVSVTGMKGGYSDWSYQHPGALERMKKYVASIIEAMDADDRVERYAWFPYNVESSNEIDGLDGCGTTALFDYESGKFTELGILYSEMGNPEGYNPQIITEDEKYVWVDPSTKPTEVPTTTEQPTTKQQVNPTVKPTTATTTKITKVQLKQVKNNKKRAVSLKWKKVKNAKKYQIQYSLHKKFKSGKKFKTRTKYTSKISFTIKKLTKKKTYFFRIRAINGKQMGAWSKTKKVKIKK
ncbi:MAG: hypothetical protein HFG29_07685 [Eubacterium sp.]|nr:hypothetical protein [Eubacterium sp.]